jgi:diguanylate cyclase (GGDEF)-like protein
VGDQRDRVAFLRDHRADERDDLANARDRAAELADAGPQQWRESARRHGAERRLAAADRSSASQDRLDVDHLKAVNDEGGHLAGDRMLVQVATALKAQLRAHDLVIRVGGDEFVCVVAGLDRPVVAARLARVNDALSAATPPGSVSFGLAELRPGDTSESLVERADAELYRGRRAARSTSDADPLDPAV